MGWLFKYKCNTAQALKSDILEQLGDKVVDTSSTGNEFYVLIKTPVSDDVTDSGDGTGRVILCIMMASGKHEGWGYKDMDESCGPYIYGCAERLLKQSTCIAGHATDWRKKCSTKRQHKNAAAAIIKNLQVGSVIDTDTRKGVTFLRHYNKSKTAFVGKTQTGEIYRFHIRNIPIEL